MLAYEQITKELEQVQSQISEYISEIILQLESFLAENRESLSEENSSDLKRIFDSTHLLQTELDRVLSAQQIAEWVNKPDFSDYLTRVRHDLRNPVNVILGYTEMIIEENPSSTQFSEVISTVEKILNAINKIKSSSETHIKKSSISLSEHDQSILSVKEKISEEFKQFKENFSILIVDDLKANCDLLEKYLNKIGYFNLHSVINGFEALALAKDYDLILLDIDMPGISGIEVLKQLKESIAERRLMVLMISAADTLENVIECIKLGAEDFLNKPFNQELLKVRIGASVEKAWSSHLEKIFRAKLEFENQRYEELLYSIFPPLVVRELKESGELQTRNYPNVAILFADVVDFTPYCDTHDLKDVSDSLQEFAAMCENVVAKNNLQKIKTIGDAFLGVAGMLMVTENPVLDCIRCGQEFIRETEKLNSKWKLHIGINYGTVIGGIVGKRQFLFDIWGDSVNTAARVQSMTEPNTIYLSGAAWEQVATRCKGHSLGEIKLKGKNPLEIFAFEDFIK